MKPSFSFSDALSAPFSLLRRRPLYVLVWGLMMMAVVAAIYALMLPIFMTAPFGDQSGEFLDAYTQELMRLSGLMNVLSLIMYLVMLVLWTAAGRATLSPGRGDRFLFLRLGMDEVRVAAVMIAVIVGWYIALIILVLLGAGIGIGLWQMDQTTAVVTLAIYGLIIFAASIWALVRLSLMAPASLILKRFAFAEGWALARGQVWKLIGLNLLVYVINCVSMLLIYAVVGGILIAGFLGQGLQWPSEVNGFADVEPVLRAMVLPGVVALVPLTFAMGWMMSLYASPAVVVARQLLDGAPITRDAPPVHRLELP